MRAFSICLIALVAGIGSAQDVVTVAPPVPTEEPEWNDDDAFTSAVLNSTNFYRTQHNASDVTWNTTLEEFAVDYLDENGCEFEHSGGPYGENLAMGYPNATASVEAWGDERDDYNFRRGKFDMDTGHFTQLVWQNTTDMGCGRKLCDRSWYLVCEYWPRGNVEGQYQEMVHQQVGLGSIVRPGAGVALLVVLGWALVWM